MDIAEVARRSGMLAATLQRYEEKKLIRAIGRHGLRCVFPAGVLDQLAPVALGRAAAAGVFDRSAGRRKRGPAP